MFCDIFLFFAIFLFVLPIFPAISLVCPSSSLWFSLYFMLFEYIPICHSVCFGIWIVWWVAIYPLSSYAQLRNHPQKPHIRIAGVYLFAIVYHIFVIYSGIFTTFFAWKSVFCRTFFMDSRSSSSFFSFFRVSCARFSRPWSFFLPVWAICRLEKSAPAYIFA